MKAALLFSANPQPADGLSPESLPGTGLPATDRTVDKFSTVMEGALSQLSGSPSDTGKQQRTNEPVPTKVLSPEISGVIRQMHGCLKTTTDKLVSTPEDEVPAGDEKSDPDQEGKQSMLGDAVAMMMVSQVPPIPQTPLAASSAAAPSATTMTISVNSKGGASATGDLALAVPKKPNSSDLSGDLIPLGKMRTGTNADSKVSSGLIPVTTSPPVEPTAATTSTGASKPVEDQSRTLADALRPLDSPAKSLSSPASSKDSLPAASQIQMISGDGILSGKPASSADKTPSITQSESGTSTVSSAINSSWTDGAVLDPALITSVEKSDGPSGAGASAQSPETGNQMTSDERLVVTSSSGPMTVELGKSDKSVGPLNRRPLFSSSDDGSAQSALSGTGGAKLDNRTMKSVEQDQNAGLRLQRLPSDQTNLIDGASGAGDLSGFRSGPRSILDGDSVFRPLAADLASQTGVSRLDAFDASSATRAGGNPAERVERLEHLILKEASVVRQSGAESLSVILKPDPQTEVFLQINQRAGQMEAIVRFDRGGATGLGLHWPQLQESLARMDVQLQPMKEFAPSTADHNSLASFSSTDQQNSSEHRMPQARLWESDTVPGEAVFKREPMRQDAAKTRHQSGWESWA